MAKDALSRERIVKASIELLDEEGENGLTFRALATRLSTGAGAIYWHIENKDELLAAATDAVVTDVLGGVTTTKDATRSIHRLALGVFDAIDTHPWLGPQLSRAPWSETAMLRIFERIGREVQALGVKGRAQFTAASALLNYILGVSTQNAAQRQFARRVLDPSIDRADYLAKVAARWKELDAEEHPFTRKVAAHLRDHDDRAEFLAGIDLILAGLAAPR